MTFIPTRRRWSYTSGLLETIQEYFLHVLCKFKHSWKQRQRRGTNLFWEAWAVQFLRERATYSEILLRGRHALWGQANDLSSPGFSSWWEQQGMLLRENTSAGKCLQSSPCLSPASQTAPLRMLECIPIQPFYSTVMTCWLWICLIAFTVRRFRSWTSKLALFFQKTKRQPALPPTP